MELEYRTGRKEGVEIVEVSYPQRSVELIVMPYETPTEVAHRGRMIEEIVTKGAYGNGIAGRKDIRVNRDHDVARTCGRAVKFHPSRQEGLVAELRIAKTDLGEETLELAADGLLDASAGFALQIDGETKKIKQGAEVWETRDRRRLNHLWLGHIALTPEPAYETANVLAVRHTEHGLVVAEAARPNLERLEVDRLREQYADLDRRYSVGQH